MPRRPRLAPHVLIGLALSLGAATDDANWRRLRSMPREHRLILAEKIKEFDRLDRGEQARIREIDRKLAELPPADQATYRSVLRRYHIWLQSLPEDQRSQIDAAPAGEKLAVVAKLRAMPGRGDLRGPSPLTFQLADLRGRSPFEMAHILEIWFSMGPDQRAELETLAPPQRLLRMFQFAKRAKIPPPAGLPEEKEAEALRALEKNAQLKGWLLGQLKKVGTEKFFVDRRRLANNYHFVVNPPRPVSSANLLRFETAMPSWFRTTFDHLPPDEAKRRLTVLYRLIYPPPREMPASGPFTPKAAVPEAAPATKAAPSPKRGPARSGDPPN